MSEIGNNDPCPCGSGKKYKKCCRDKQPRQNIVTIASPIPLKGFHYNRDTMEIDAGISYDDQIVDLPITFSETHYIGKAGKEKVLSRIQEKAIPNLKDLYLYLSSFDMIIAVDTNTKIIDSDRLSVSGVVPCTVRATDGGNVYDIEYMPHGAILFRNCPENLSPEKFGWLLTVDKYIRNQTETNKKYCLISDYDLNNHTLYNNRSLPIYKDVYLPSNIVLMYGKGDSSKENILNVLIKHCDKEASRVLKEFEEKRFYEYQDTKYSINQIPVPVV